MKRLCSIITIGIISLSPAKLALANGENICTLMPTELIGIAERSGYSQITQFYSTLLGNVDAPFIYGYRPDMDKWNSVAFWCQDSISSKVENAKSYLVFVTLGPYTQIRIEKIISWHRFGGLSLFHDTTVSMDKFTKLDDPKVKGPADEKFSGYGVTSEYDSYSFVFCKFEGEWYVRSDLDW